MLELSLLPPPSFFLLLLIELTRADSGLRVYALLTTSFFIMIGGPVRAWLLLLFILLSMAKVSFLIRAKALRSASDIGFLSIIDRSVLLWFTNLAALGYITML